MHWKMSHEGELYTNDQGNPVPRHMCTISGPNTLLQSAKGGRTGRNGCQRNTTTMRKVTRQQKARCWSMTSCVIELIRTTNPFIRVLSWILLPQRLWITYLHNVGGARCVTCWSVSIAISPNSAMDHGRMDNEFVQPCKSCSRIRFVREWKCLIG